MTGESNRFEVGNAGPEGLGSSGSSDSVRPELGEDGSGVAGTCVLRRGNALAQAARVLLERRPEVLRLSGLAEDAAVFLLRPERTEFSALGNDQSLC